MRRIILRALLVVGVLVVVALGRYLVVAAPAGTGLAAKQLCSLVYVSGLDIDRASDLYLDSLIPPLTWIINVENDTDARVVTSTGFRWWQSRAQFRPGLGCTLLHGVDSLPDVPVAAIDDRPLPEAGPEQLAAVDREALQRSLTAVFDPDSGWHNTLAVVVLYDGHVVAERYARGITARTSLPGWSMAKSVTATLAGILVRQGKLRVDAPGALRQVEDAPGPLSTVTLNHLLRMTSGIDLTETNSGADPASEMLFLAPDAAAFTAARGLQAKPDEHWEYTSGSTVLAARVVADQVGGTLEDALAFVREELFEPLGLATAVLEPDQAGTFIGSSYMLASARDWAKIGQLYLNGGVYQGRRIVDEDWVEYVQRHTPISGTAAYGAGFWLNRPTATRHIAGLPSDSYFMSGFQGQQVFIVPSKRTVIVRLGASRGHSGMQPFVAGVIDAVSG